jgi:hypothetical protein
VSCSLRTYAVNTVGNALASGNSVYESDADIELVGAALPFGLKLTESLLAESPKHDGLLLTACRGFTMYSYAYVAFDAERLSDEDLRRDWWRSTDAAVGRRHADQRGARRDISSHHVADARRGAVVRAGWVRPCGGPLEPAVARVLSVLVGWIPGGLAIVTVAVLAFFTPLTGASGVTIVSMGGLLLPVLVGARYPASTSLGLVTVSGSIGLLFFPSLPVFLYGFYANQPFDKLFVGSLVPGVLLVAAVAAWAAARGHGGGAERTRYRSTLPYSLIVLAVVLLITYLPGLTLWLVRVFESSGL